ncbi:hypothetical protein RB484 [Rhodopirellula baltica SH 1]|uniref:Uncharacterized protein n=1 Tax=Rhodopirellula baltica (strain DSM 10527 / NCIMB 13988 / SH1) TaxID=243090 RepID=Q7UYN1_RHOBA|nr:hypothetical protein RB484 [Rhodopirellula baltica SH 1]
MSPHANGSHAEILKKCPLGSRSSGSDKFIQLIYSGTKEPRAFSTGLCRSSSNLIGHRK